MVNQFRGQCLQRIFEWKLMVKMVGIIVIKVSSFFPQVGSDVLYSYILSLSTLSIFKSLVSISGSESKVTVFVVGWWKAVLLDSQTSQTSYYLSKQSQCKAFLELT